MHTSQQKLTVEIIASSTDTAKAAPHAKGSVRYNSVSGSSSSSGSKNPTLLSTTSSVPGGKCQKKNDYRLFYNLGRPWMSKKAK